MTLEELIKDCPICNQGNKLLHDRLEMAKRGAAERIKEIKFFADGIELRTEKKPNIDSILEKSSESLRLASSFLRSLGPYTGPHDHSSFESFKKSFEAYTQYWQKGSKDLNVYLKDLPEFLLDKRDELWKACDAANEIWVASLLRTETKQFTESKTIPATTGKEKNKMAKKMRVFHEGEWQEYPTQDDELGERIKAYFKENPSVDPSTVEGHLKAAAAVTKEMQAESGDDERKFSDDGRQAVEHDSDIPSEIVAEFSKIPRRAAKLTFSSDQKWARDPRGKIFPVKSDDEGSVQEFEERTSRPRHVKPRAEVEAGFSKDGKTFTDLQGQSVPVHRDLNEEAETELFGFAMQFEYLMRQLGVAVGSRNDVAAKAIRLLRAGGFDQPQKASPDNAMAAFKAATAGEQKFAKALRYAVIVPEVFPNFAQACHSATMKQG